MPDRSVSVATNGEDGCFSTTRAVRGSTTSTRSIAPSSARRKLPARPAWRSRLNLTAAASNAVPSWKATPDRRCRTSVTGSAHSKDVASRGTMASISPLIPAVLNGPVAQLRMSAVAGCANVPTPGKLSSPPLTWPVTVPQDACVSMLSVADSYSCQTWLT